MNRSLGQHGVVLELGLAERGSVGGNDDQLSLAGAQSLHGRLNTQGDLAGLHHQGEPGVDLPVEKKIDFSMTVGNADTRHGGFTHVVGTLLGLLVGGHLYALK